MLKTWYQAHIALRTYYPEIEQFYQDVRNGRLTMPLPIDAFEAIQIIVADHTPDIFEPSVGKALDMPSPGEVANAPPSPREEPVIDALTIVEPPKDPLGDVDPNASDAHQKAGIVGTLMKTVEAGEKLNKGAEGWGSLLQKLKDPFGSINKWATDYFSNGGTPPDLPPTIGI